MNTNDEELQQRIESGVEGDDRHSNAYRHIFRALEADPGTGLSVSFADKVVMIARGKQKQRKSRELVWIGVGAVLLLVALVTAVVMTGYKLNLGFLSGMSAYKGLALFGILFIGLLNWIDKRFVSQKQ